MTKNLVRLAAVLSVALCTSACSTIDDLIGDTAPSSTADANGFPPDTATPSADADGSNPDLAGIPDRPTGVTKPDAQREAADSLAADAARSKYSSEALRGGAEAAAAPPPPAGSPVVETTKEDAGNALPAPSSQSENTGNQEEEPAAPHAAPAASEAPTHSSPVPSASSLPPGTQPAVPAIGNVPGTQPMVVADSSLGFKPSSAPPLDPTISQFVASPIIARYQESASRAGVPTGSIAPLNAGTPETIAKLPRSHASDDASATTGAVVANLGTLNGPGATSAYSNAVGGTPQAVVLFPGDGTTITASAREQIRAVVHVFQQRGGSGFIKVVGHSSSRTANMGVEKHLMAIFAKSQARANAVAREIIREGIPASHVLVEAVGDSQPVYYESMPRGEEGNRRAEIFIQG